MTPAATVCLKMLWYCPRKQFCCSDKWIKMVNFKLRNEMWKVNWPTWHELGTKKKFESPTRIEPMTSRTPNSVKWTLRFMSSRGSVDRAPSWCSRGHGFVFLCSTLVPYWPIITLHNSVVVFFDLRYILSFIKKSYSPCNFMMPF